MSFLEDREQLASALMLVGLRSLGEELMQRAAGRVFKGPAEKWKRLLPPSFSGQHWHGCQAGWEM